MQNAMTRYLDDDTDYYLAPTLTQPKPLEEATGTLQEGEIPTVAFHKLWLIRSAPEVAILNNAPWLNGKRGQLSIREWGPMVAAIRQESEFAPVGQIGDLPGYEEWNQLGVQEAVGKGIRPCPLCGGGDGPFLIHEGHDTGLVLRMGPCKCPCHRAKTFWHFWAGKDREDQDLVPSRFRDVHLAALKPSRLSKLTSDRQQVIIDKLKASPAESYFLFGGPKTGKTHLATALYRDALNRWVNQEYEQRDGQQAVWRVRTSTLLDQHVAWACKGNSTEDVPCPAVTVGKLKEAIGKGYSPSLILEEIDKVPSTPFKLARLIELVDCVYEAQGQVIATSNASMSDLAAKWGADEAETILRRIGDGPGAITIKFE